MCASGKREVRAYVAVGSNIEPRKNVEEALRRLGREVQVEAISTFYWTRALGVSQGPEFLNGVVKVSTTLGARELKFSVLRVIEEAMGRRRSADKNAARVIDLDLVAYGDEVVREEGLERAFVVKPLAELSPELTLPGGGERVSELASVLGAEGMREDGQFTQRLRAGRKA